jgi:glutathionylspermidine synthase
MKRRSAHVRPNWIERVESLGFAFHSTPDGYWDESAYYEFNADEIDILEKAANDVQELCLQAVEEIISNKLFDYFQLPPDWAHYVTQSWGQDEPTLYGRFDFGYREGEPPKLLEYNADTPTALLEAAVIQWHWLQDIDPRADQFNSIHERLIDAWRFLHGTITDTVYFTSLAGSAEDEITVQYLRDTAIQAGLVTAYLPIHQVGWDHARQLFVDMSNRPIRHLFKLYPWEWLLREQFGPNILRTSTAWYEPPWKMLLSNKAILPLLWRMFPDHPNLLRAHFEPFSDSYVKKPCLGREGANVQIVEGGREIINTPGQYEGDFVYQDVFPVPSLDGHFPVLGCWIVGNIACGMGIRESADRVTRNTSRFVPHLFRPKGLETLS